MTAQEDIELGISDRDHSGNPTTAQERRSSNADTGLLQAAPRDEQSIENGS
jgi:hypothetical protein